MDLQIRRTEDVPPDERDKWVSADRFLAGLNRKDRRAVLAKLRKQEEDKAIGKK